MNPTDHHQRCAYKTACPTVCAQIDHWASVKHGASNPSRMLQTCSLSPADGLQKKCFLDGALCVQMTPWRQTRATTRAETHQDYSYTSNPLFDSSKANSSQFDFTERAGSPHPLLTMSQARILLRRCEVASASAMCCSEAHPCCFVFSSSKQL